MRQRSAAIVAPRNHNHSVTDITMRRNKRHVARWECACKVQEIRRRAIWWARTDDVLRLYDCGNSRNFKNDSLLDEGAAHLVGNRLEEIAHHRPASRLHENLGRHSGHQLLTGESPALLVRQDDSHREIRRVGLLVAA